jgi:hypothetical protein
MAFLRQNKSNLLDLNISILKVRHSLQSKVLNPFGTFFRIKYLHEMAERTDRQWISLLVST